MNSDHYAGGETAGVHRDLQSDTLGAFFKRGQHYFSVSPALSRALERTEDLLSWNVRDFSLPYNALYVHFGEEGPALFESGPGERYRGNREETEAELRIDSVLPGSWHLEGAYLFRYYVRSGEHYQRYKKLLEEARADDDVFHEAMDHFFDADHHPHESPIPESVTLVAAQDGYGGKDYPGGKTPWDFLGRERWIHLSLQEQEDWRSLGPQATLEDAIEEVCEDYEQAYREHTGEIEHVPGWAKAIDVERGIWLRKPLEKALNHVMSAAMTMSARPEMIRARWPEGAPEGLAQKAEKARHRGDISAAERTESKIQSQGYRRILLDHRSDNRGSGSPESAAGARGGSETIDSKLEEGRGPSSHWRRGHFRTQRYGEGLKKRKVIWIEPVFVGGSEEEVPDVAHEYHMDERLASGG